MKGERLKKLAKLRLILSVIAVLLALVMAVSGVMHFIVDKPAPEEPSPTETVETTTAPTEPETEDTTEANVEQTEASEETAPEGTVAGNQVVVEDPDGNTVDDDKKEKKPHKDTPSRNPNKDTTNDDPNKDTADDSNKDTTDDPNKDTTVDDPNKDTTTNDPNKDTAVDDSNKDTTTDDSNKDTTTDDSNKNTTSNPSKDTTGDSSKDTSGDSNKTTTTDESSKTDSLSASHGTIAVHAASLTEQAETIAAETEPVAEATGSSFPWGILFWASAGLLAVDLIAILVISNSISQELKKQERTRNRIRRAHENAMQDERPMPDYRNPPQRQEKPSQPAAPGRSLRQTLPAPQVATIHQVGRREYQQDSLGHTAVLDDRGTLAVLADGMGGLSDGEKVSQKIVMDALTLGHQLTPGQINGALRKMVSRINDDVNQMLGPDGLYKSGSTLVAVLVSDGQFQWISVGDSRIYLYRQGYASQLNQDHDQLQVWMADVLAGTRSMDEVLRNPDGRKLTSFIGMGQLKYVDGSLTPIALEPGDRLVLMSDGIYGAVSEEALAEVLKRYPDVSQAASVIERMVREAKHPHQDNYTAIVLGF